MSTVSTSNPSQFLGLSPNSKELSTYLRALSKTAELDAVPERALKVYPDSVYANYYTLGISFRFVSRTAAGALAKSLCEDDLHGDALKLDNIDIYNNMGETGGGHKKKGSQPSFASHPVPDLLIPLRTEGQNGATALQVSKTSTGKDFVDCLGEPDRKGGGSGPSSGSIDIWCEWSKKGIMVGFGGLNREVLKLGSEERMRDGRS